MTDGQVVAITDSADEWMDVGVAATRLGFDAATLLRLIEAGDMPSIGIKGAQRTARRIPRLLVEEARRAVFAGAQVELREFARQWAARNVAEAVA